MVSTTGRTRLRRAVFSADSVHPWFRQPYDGGMSTSPRSLDVKRDWGHDETGCTVLHVDMDAFFEILNIQQTYDGGCIIQGLIIDAITTKAIIMKINKNEIMMNTEIHDDNDNLFVEAYPNPVSSVLNIDIENLICDEAMIEIFDISGRRCMQNKIVPESNLLSLDLSSLDRGIYNYKIINYKFS